nr:MAG TPA: hypothetical protein [Caudoviricetes sp.]
MGHSFINQNVLVGSILQKHNSINNGRKLCSKL